LRGSLPHAQEIRCRGDVICRTDQVVSTPRTPTTAGKNLGLETRHWRIRITEHAASDVRGCATDSKT
jgi:hypothetical protein